MRRLTCLIVLVTAVVSTSVGQGRQDLAEVGLSIDYAGTWEQMTLLSGPEGTKPGEPEFSAGFAFLVDADISDSTRYSHNVVQIARHDVYSDSMRATWLDGRDLRTGDTGKVEISWTPTDIALDLPFSEYRVFRFLENRGDEYQQRSAGYVVFAIEGKSLYRVVVSGIERTFDADPEPYKALLNSLVLTQQEGEDVRG